MALLLSDTELAQIKEALAAQHPPPPPVAPQSMPNPFLPQTQPTVGAYANGGIIPAYDTGGAIDPNTDASGNTWTAEKGWQDKSGNTWSAAGGWQDASGNKWTQPTGWLDKSGNDWTQATGWQDPSDNTWNPQANTWADPGGNTWTPTPAAPDRWTDPAGNTSANGGATWSNDLPPAPRLPGVGAAPLASLITPAAGVLPESTLRPLVAKYFRPEDVDKALYVISLESNGGRPGGQPAILGDNGASGGLFQLNDGGLGAGMTNAQKFDAETNIRTAAQAVYGGSGWKPWGEGALYKGAIFGSLGNHPYKKPPAYATGGTIPAFAGGGDIDSIMSAIDAIQASGSAVPQELLDQLAAAQAPAPELAYQAQYSAPPAPDPYGGMAQYAPQPPSPVVPNPFGINASPSMASSPWIPQSPPEAPAYGPQQQEPTSLFDNMAGPDVGPNYSGMDPNAVNQAMFAPRPQEPDNSILTRALRGVNSAATFPVGEISNLVQGNGLVGYPAAVAEGERAFGMESQVNPFLGALGQVTANPLTLAGGPEGLLPILGGTAAQTAYGQSDLPGSQNQLANLGVGILGGALTHGMLRPNPETGVSPVQNLNRLGMKALSGLSTEDVGLPGADPATGMPSTDPNAIPKYLPGKNTLNPDYLAARALTKGTAVTLPDGIPAIVSASYDGQLPARIPVTLEDGSVVKTGRNNLTPVAANGGGNAGFTSAELEQLQAMGKPVAEPALPPGAQSETAARAGQNYQADVARPPQPLSAFGAEGTGPPVTDALPPNVSRIRSVLEGKITPQEGQAVADTAAGRVPSPLPPSPEPPMFAAARGEPLTPLEPTDAALGNFHDSLQPGAAGGGGEPPRPPSVTWDENNNMSFRAPEGAPADPSFWQKRGINWNVPGDALRQLVVFGHAGIRSLQGFLLGVEHPGEWMQNNLTAVKALRDPALVQAGRVEAVHYFDSTYGDGFSGDLVNNGSKGFGGSGGDYQSRSFVGDLPAIKQMNRAIVAGHEADIRSWIDVLAKTTQAANEDKYGSSDFQPGQVKQIAQSSNHLAMTIKSGNNPIVNTLLFAPKMLAAQVALIGDAFHTGPVGAEVRSVLGDTAFKTIGTTIAYNMATSGGKSLWGPGITAGIPTDRQDWNKLLSDPNFLSIRLPGSNSTLRPFGPFTSQLKLAFHLAGDVMAGNYTGDIRKPGSVTSDLTQWGQSHLSPLAGLFGDLMVAKATGQLTDYKGQPTSLQGFLQQHFEPIAFGAGQSVVQDVRAGNPGSVASDLANFGLNVTQHADTAYAQHAADLTDLANKMGGTWLNPDGSPKTYAQLTSIQKRYSDATIGAPQFNPNSPTSIKFAADQKTASDLAAGHDQRVQAASDKYAIATSAATSDADRAAAGVVFRDAMTTEAAIQAAERANPDLPQFAPSKNPVSQAVDAYYKAIASGGGDPNEQANAIQTLMGSWSPQMLSDVIAQIGGPHVSQSVIDAANDPTADMANQVSLLKNGGTAAMLLGDQKKIADSGFWNAPNKEKFLEDQAPTGTLASDSELFKTLARWGYATPTLKAIGAYELYGTDGQQQKAADAKLAADPSYAKQWRADMHTNQDALRNTLNGIYNPVDGTTVSPILRPGTNAALDAYYKFVDSTKDPANGKPDWNAVDRYVAENPDAQTALDARVGRPATQTVQDYRADVKRIAATDYWDAKNTLAAGFAKYYQFPSTLDSYQKVWQYIYDKVYPQALPYYQGDREAAGAETTKQVNQSLADVTKQTSDYQKQWRAGSPELVRLLIRWGFYNPSNAALEEILAKR